jgi:LEA14-like dessication related protein
MTSRTKKILVISGSVIAGLGVTLLLLYRQAKKLIEYNLRVKRLKIEKISMNDLRLKIFMLFKNPSKLTIVLTKQEYDISLNGVYITTLKSDTEQVVEPNSVSELNVDLAVDPALVFQKLAHMQKPLELITKFKSQKLTLVSRLYVRFGFFSIPITVDYTETIRDFGE